jgi:DNA repair exonuclease SbcCD ATPase subunit
VCLTACDLVAAVLGLADKYTSAKAALATQALKPTSSSSSIKLRETEEKLESAVSEIDSLKAQRASLEKRVETLKASVKTARTDSADISAALDACKAQCEQLEADLEAARGHASQLELKMQQKLHELEASAGNSPEVQALEEENLELMNENKQLTREICSYRLQAERAQAQLAKLQDGGAVVEAVPSVGGFSKKRTFGTDLSTQSKTEENVIKDLTGSPASKQKKVVGLSESLIGVRTESATSPSAASKTNENVKPRARAKVAVLPTALTAANSSDDAPVDGCAQS